MRKVQPAAVRLVTLFVTLVLGSAVPAAAQRSWDVAGFTGGWWGRPEEASTPERYDDEWFGAWVGSMSVGRYWSPFIKTEIDATLSSEGDRYVTQQVVLPGERSPRFFSTETQHQERSVAALLTLQAGRNWWVHPFIQGGVSVDWDRVRTTAFPILIGGGGRDPSGHAGRGGRRRQVLHERTQLLSRRRPDVVWRRRHARAVPNGLRHRFLARPGLRPKQGSSADTEPV
jgi:hypothetical protein